jgi:hypothetical protein
MRAKYLRPVIPAVHLGRNPVLFDTFGSKELDPDLKLAGVTYTTSNPAGQCESSRHKIGSKIGVRSCFSIFSERSKIRRLGEHRENAGRKYSKAAQSFMRAKYLRPVIPAVHLGRNPVLFDTFGSKELDPDLKLAGVTYTTSNPCGAM